MLLYQRYHHGCWSTLYQQLLPAGKTFKNHFDIILSSITLKIKQLQTAFGNKTSQTIIQIAGHLAILFYINMYFCNHLVYTGDNQGLSVRAILDKILV